MLNATCQAPWLRASRRVPHPLGAHTPTGRQTVFSEHVAMKLGSAVEWGYILGSILDWAPVLLLRLVCYAGPEVILNFVDGLLTWLLTEIGI